MIILAKAILNGINCDPVPGLAPGAFIEWDTSTLDFYFYDWTLPLVTPRWDCNQWYALRYHTERDAKTDVEALASLGFVVAPLGNEAIVEPNRTRNAYHPG
jgi:hypothetical protein